MITMLQSGQRNPPASMRARKATGSRDCQVVAPHAQRVVNMTVIDRIRNPIIGRNGVLRRGNVNGKIGVVVIANGEGEIEKSEEKVHDQYQQF